MGQNARRRHTPEQIIRKLREADRLLGEGLEVAAVAKQLEVSEQTLHRWRVQYGAWGARTRLSRGSAFVFVNQTAEQIASDHLRRALCRARCDG
jgi:transposase-like protein